MKEGDRVEVIANAKGSWANYVGRTGRIERRLKKNEEGQWFKVILDRASMPRSGSMTFLEEELAAMEEKT